jgi:hypothetical protein
MEWRGLVWDALFEQGAVVETDTHVRALQAGRPKCL